MAINETISTGNKYRRLKDATNKVWQRLSFWTKASDVEFDSGYTAQATLGNITGITDSINSAASNVAASANAVYQLNSKLSNFQNGVNTLYNQCVSYGVTPSSTNLNAISSALATVYNTGYNNGYNTGYSTGQANAKKSLLIRLSASVTSYEQGYADCKIYQYNSDGSTTLIFDHNVTGITHDTGYTNDFGLTI